MQATKTTVLFRFVGALAVFAVLLGGVWYLYFCAVRAPVITADLSQRDHITFAAIGDTGSGQFAQWRVGHAIENLAERRDLDFVALLGDNFYGGGIDSVDDLQWRYKFENMYRGPELDTLPFYAVLGNHDYDGDWRAQVDYTFSKGGSQRWNMPHRYYSRDFGSVGNRPLLRIVFLDTNAQGPALSEQTRFLEQKMGAEPAPIWKVVAGHHPVRNEGHHGDTLALVAGLLPLLKSLHVDLYLSGHDHNLQFIERADEPAYLISGAGSQVPYQLKKNDATLQFSRAANGFSTVKAEPDELEVKFYNISGHPISTFEQKRSCVDSRCVVSSFKHIS